MNFTLLSFPTSDSKIIFDRLWFWQRFLKRCQKSIADEQWIQRSRTPLCRNRWLSFGVSFFRQKSLALLNDVILFVSDSSTKLLNWGGGFTGARRKTIENQTLSDILPWNDVRQRKNWWNWRNEFHTFLECNLNNDWDKFSVSYGFLTVSDPEAAIEHQ